LTTYITRNVQQEKLEKQKKITVAKLLVREKRISSAPKLSKPGGSWIWISTCWPVARETKSSNNFRCTRERERENQNDERIGGKARSKRGGRTRCTKQTHCKTLIRPITIYTPQHLYVLPKACIIHRIPTVYIFFKTLYSIYFWVLIYLKRKINKFMFGKSLLFFFCQFNFSISWLHVCNCRKTAPQN
jgi:hypothetical protein